MIAFQYAALLIILALLVADLWQLWHKPAMRCFRVCRVAAWSAAGLAIALPEAAQRAARGLGIHRGADLVLYSFVLFSLFTFFLLYSRQTRLQRHITELVRQYAIEHARRVGRRREHAFEDERLA